MHFQPIALEQYETVRQFLSEMGWTERVSDRTKFQQMMQRADRTVVATEAEKVIGFGRALCDDVSNGYISMLAVAPEWRGQGIGSEIVSLLVGDDPGITWVLRAGRGSSEFWKRQGFTVSEVAMERTRSKTSDTVDAVKDLSLTSFTPVLNQAIHFAEKSELQTLEDGDPCE